MDRAFLDGHLRREVRDLGEAGVEALRGVYACAGAEEAAPRFVHEQFTAAAERYAARYEDTAYFKSLLTAALARSGWTRHAEPVSVLDLGSGSGNTIFPLLEICPRSAILATDLSVELLAMLKRGLERRGLADRCLVLQLNAEELDFRPDSFDLVVGAAILHHLFSPPRVIEGVARILRPGGRAIFFEPFEAGNMLLRVAYRQILDDVRSLLVPRRVKRFLRDLMHDFEVRKGTDKEKEIFRHIDDKWLFTRSYFEELAREHGFRRCTVTPLLAPADMFAAQTASYLRLGLGLGRDALPPWAWRRIRRLDEFFSPEAKEDLVIEGAIVLER